MMVLMWLRTYPSYATLSLMFDVPRTTVSNIINSMIQPLHELYAWSVRWTTVAEWTTLGGKWRDMPLVVGMIDATSHRNYKPKTERETLYYSGHKHFHCVHTQIIVDNNGVLRYIKSGFKGHNNNATTFRQLPFIGPNEQLDSLPPPPPPHQITIYWLMKYTLQGTLLSHHFQRLKYYGDHCTRELHVADLTGNCQSGEWLLNTPLETLNYFELSKLYIATEKKGCNDCWTLCWTVLSQSRASIDFMIMPQLPFVS